MLQFRLTTLSKNTTTFHLQKQQGSWQLLKTQDYR